MTAATLLPIPFPAAGDMLWAAPDAKAMAVVALKPICENLGLAWHAQRRRVHRTPVLAASETMMVSVAADGKSREVLCLPLKMIPGWLFGIDANRVKAEIREKLITYQRECFDVLWERFGGAARAHDAAALGEGGGGGPGEPPELDSASVHPEAIRTSLEQMRTQDIKAWTELIREYRVGFGQQGALRIIRRSPLPQVDDLIGATHDPDQDHVAEFLRDCCEADPESSVQASVLYRCYSAWCDEQDISPLGQRGFGLRMQAYHRKVKASVTWYRGLRLKDRPADDDKMQ